MMAKWDYGDNVEAPLAAGDGLILDLQGWINRLGYAGGVKWPGGA